jgi:hypothetical protein
MLVCVFFLSHKPKFEHPTRFGKNRPDHELHRAVAGILSRVLTKLMCSFYQISLGKQSRIRNCKNWIKTGLHVQLSHHDMFHNAISAHISRKANKVCVILQLN